MITNLSIGHYGRFCNLLFQIAAVVGIARKSNQPYGFLPIFNYDHKELFGSTEDIDLEKHFVNPFPRLNKDAKEFMPRAYGWGYEDIYLPSGNWDISGHFQSEKYFEHCLDEVRALLTMTNEPGPQDFIAIHVRRGDYDDIYHPILQADYYRPAMESFPQGTAFWIFSDDMVKARQVIFDTGIAHKYTFRSAIATDYLDDFRCMKNCKGFICANSSYSLMAAILSPTPGKKIICPRNWFGPAWKPETRDIYPKNSIII